MNGSALQDQELQPLCLTYISSLTKWGLGGSLSNLPGSAAMRGRQHTESHEGVITELVQEMQRQIGKGTKLTPVSLTVIKKALKRF